MARENRSPCQERVWSGQKSMAAAAVAARELVAAAVAEAHVAAVVAELLVDRPAEI